MSSLEVWSASCLLAAWLGQAWFFRSLLRRLYQTRHSIPPPDTLRLRHAAVPWADITTTRAEVLAERYSREELPPTPMGRVIKLSLLHAEAYETTEAYRVTAAVNSYLIRSRGAAIDFVLIKNLVDRHTQLNERQIRYQTWIPLGIGLITLVFAVSLGLLFLPNLSDQLIDRAALAGGATLLLSSVRWVALAILTGTLLTLVTIGVLHPQARWEVLRRKERTVHTGADGTTT